MPHRERVQQVIDWLALPADKRPDLVTLYFSVVDSASHTFGHKAPATLSSIIETAPPRVFRQGGGKNADLRGYPATVEDIAAFLVAVGPRFEVGKVIPEAHQLDVYPVAATLLDLRVPDNILSNGGSLRAILREP